MKQTNLNLEKKIRQMHEMKLPYYDTMDSIS